MRAFFSAVLLVVSIAPPIFASCGVAIFTPFDGLPDPEYPKPGPQQALYLTDPAGEQTALFSMEWGGALVSLKYNGQELVWGHASGALVQPTVHNGSFCYDYNPTPAGVVQLGPGTPLLGAACSSTQVTIYSGSSDYPSDQRSAKARALTVRNGQIIPHMWSTPYVLTTIAKFVPNSNPPGVGPAYYLQLDQHFANIDSRENPGFLLELAGYVPGDFCHRRLGRRSWNQSTGTYDNVTDAQSCSASTISPSSCFPTGSVACAPAFTRSLAVGFYPLSTAETGVAFGIAPSHHWSAHTGTTGFINAYDPVNHNWSTHLESRAVAIPPGVAQHFVWYVMAGSWSQAFDFIQTAN